MDGKDDWSLIDSHLSKALARPPIPNVNPFIRIMTCEHSVFRQEKGKTSITLF
jgi:hypothetical protein